MAENADAVRYFLCTSWSPWTEVTKAEWVRAERGAGFHNTLGKPDEPGTGGFGGHNGVSGRIVYMKYAKREGYDFDPAFQNAVWPQLIDDGVPASAVAESVEAERAADRVLSFDQFHPMEGRCACGHLNASCDLPSKGTV